MIYVYGTPVENHRLLDGREVRVKRDDLVIRDGACGLFGTPPNTGKLRAMDRIIRARPEEDISVVDRSVHSRASWIAAFVASHEAQGRRITAYVPYMGNNQLIAQSLGARVITSDSAAESPEALYAWAVDRHEREGSGYIFPDNCYHPDLIDDYAQEVHRTGYRAMAVDHIVIPVGSGGLAIGIIKGVLAMGLSPMFHLHMGGSRRTFEHVFDRVFAAAPGANLHIIPPGREESRWATLVDTPFPANAIYEKRAWRWLENAHREMRGDILFWSAGA